MLPALREMEERETARCQEGGEQQISHVSPHTVYDARQQSWDWSILCGLLANT